MTWKQLTPEEQEKYDEGERNKMLMDIGKLQDISFWNRIGLCFLFICEIVSLLLKL